VSGFPAAFLDRDGTIIHDANFVSDPADVVLLPGAADAIRRLNEHSVRVIVVTNQSGIARQYLTADDYVRVEARLSELLKVEGAHVDATYMCPHHPDITGPCNCRKPGPELYERAIREHAIDPVASLFTGDRWRDVLPGRRLGGLAILLDVDSTPPEDRAIAIETGAPTARSLAEAVDRFLDASSRRPPAIRSAR
jgi:D-glycero-D-manno-heptose 1,7-bisphosphate phosphatase